MREERVENVRVKVCFLKIRSGPDEDSIRVVVLRAACNLPFFIVSFPEEVTREGESLVTWYTRRVTYNSTILQL